MVDSPSQGLLIIERILRDREGVWRQINEERDLRAMTIQMMASSAISLAIYGAVLGASNSLWQALSSLVKLPLLFLVTLAICLPTLYLFNLVFGARLSMPQAVALIMVSVTVTSVLTLAFAPISLFFLITAQSYSFFKVLNVGILVLTALVGLRFLTVGMSALNAYQHRVAAAPPAVAGAPQAGVAAGVAGSPPLPAAEPAGLVQSAVEPAGLVPSGAEPAGLVPSAAGQLEPAVSQPASAGNGWVVAGQPVRLATAVAPPPGMVPVAMPVPVPAPAPAPVPAPRSTSMTLLYIWILLFGFVGTQLAWTLRPFFGSPGERFALFRHITGTFYSDIIHTIGRLLGG